MCRLRRMRPKLTTEICFHLFFGAALGQVIWKFFFFFLFKC